MKPQLILKNILLITLLLSLNGCLSGDSKKTDTNKNTQTEQKDKDKPKLPKDDKQDNKTKPIDTNETKDNQKSKDDNSSTNDTKTNKDNNNVSKGEDNSKNKGTSKENLTLLPPSNQPLKNEKLVLHVKDKNNQPITKNITWIVKPKDGIKQNGTNIITPIQNTDITLQAKYNDTLSNKITLHVKWIVNNHELPPMPDPKINNSTLLGIDVNNNGVRDDVERAIYEKFKSSVRQGILMQTAKAHTNMLADPDGVKNAVKWEHYIATLPIACNTYLFRKYDIPFAIEADDYMKNKLYNTKERLKKYMYYNQALGGGVYWTKESEIIENSCDFNTTKALKDDGVAK